MHGQRAFINCTRDLLLKDGITLLPSSQTVVEVLESIEPDDLVIAACERLNIAGYSIALDDYVANDRRESMVPLADIIKVDFETTTPKERTQLVKKQGGLRCRMLAEKVEMLEQFQAAQHAGFVYFQGYFFRRPEVMKTREIPANRVNYLRTGTRFRGRIWISTRWRARSTRGVGAVPVPALAELSDVLRLAMKFTPLRHALTILGERETRRWIRLVALISAGMLKSTDLVLSALLRTASANCFPRKPPWRSPTCFR